VFDWRGGSFRAWLSISTLWVAFWLFVGRGQLTSGDWGVTRPILFLMFVPPLGALFLGALAGWIVRRFRR
jgi:hypothetical protein